MMNKYYKLNQLLRTVFLLILFPCFIGDLLFAQNNRLNTGINNLADLPNLSQIPDPVPISSEFFTKYGFSENDISQTKTLQKSITNAYSFMPLGYGRGGFNIGYTLGHSGGVLPNWQQAAKLNPRIFDPFYDRRAGNITIAAGFNMFEDVTNSALSLLNATMPGGNWNQWLDQYPAPGGWNNGFPGFNQSYNDQVFNQVYSPHIQGVLGYDPNSTYNFSTQFINQANSFFSPFANSNSNFSLFPSFLGGFFAKDRSSLTLGDYYSEIAHEQIQYHFTDPELANLRKETMEVSYIPLFMDPYYIYYNFLVQDAIRQIFTTRPNYQNLLTLSQTIASWTDPPDDENELQNRYFYRYLLQYYNALVEYEVMKFYENNPQIWFNINNALAVMNERVSLYFNSEEFSNWDKSWTSRFWQSYDNDRKLAGMMEDFFQTFPQFEEYMELLDSVRELISNQEQHPTVKQVTEKVQFAFEDAEIKDANSIFYNEYQNQINNLLGQTKYVIEMERYYERVNVLQ